jgi:hypothetical protein
MYVSNRLTLIDAHTLGCPAGGVTFVPVPGPSPVDHAGLLTVELPPTVRRGERYSARVRQLTGARFGKGRQVEAGGRRKRAAAGPAEAVRAGFFYRRTVGAFGMEIPVSTKHRMLAEEERTLSILRWIERSVPVETRWWPVFRRYVDVYIGRVAGMGGDPAQIGPAGDGDWRHSGRKHPDRAGRDVVTGKVAGLRYDNFGDFTGFVVETAHDRHVLVRSRETRIEELARRGWVTRATVRVRLLDDGGIDSLSLGGHAGE